MRRPATAVTLSIAAGLAGLTGLGLTLASSGRGGETGGGDSNLPTQAIGPYKELETNFETPLNEPFVLEDIAADLVEPAILDGDQVQGRGDRLIVYVERIATAGGRGTIVRADIDPNLEASTEPPEEILAPTEPWEGNRVGAPAVLRRGDKVILFFEGGDGAQGGIGRAVSMDGGRTFTRLQKNPVLTAPGARQPTVIASPADPARQLSMYFVGDSVRGPAIFLTQSTDDGQSWGAARLVLGADSPATSDAGGVQIDLGGTEGPCAFGPTSGAGLPYVGLFYVGVSATRTRSIGYAGSFDGEHFERFPGNPVVGAGGADETGPAVRREGDRGILLYAVSAGGRRSIAAARHLVRTPTGSN